MIVNLEQNTPEWLEYRKSKFNASEAGAVMGVGFVKPYQLAAQKYGDALQTYQNEAMKEGHEREGDVREYLRQKYKLDFVPTIMQSDKDPKFSASLDGYDIMADIFCEIKWSKDELEYVKANGKPSEKYFWQIQHQFYVSEAKECVFAVGVINSEYELEVKDIIIKRDEKAIKKLINAWYEFEATYANNAPDDEWISLGKNLRDIDIQIKQLQARRDELKERAIAKANGIEQKVCGLTIYKLKRAPSYDYKSYCESEHLQIPDLFLKQGSESWAVRC